MDNLIVNTDKYTQQFNNNERYIFINYDVCNEINLVGINDIFHLASLASIASIASIASLTSISITR